ncbi:cellulose synthase operon protein YhjQ/BcsQ [Microlunatus parietis]|uniref:Pilus assembly protein CpaE n=1 Tax=Microlunatus parietis TaxID=682979 RepID=A0A7Y9IDU4_9ACTN|nr:cellulose synthase operon protein YhjQ/BcsQ [Microlunatus parietis]NYE74902.1 pilus assembly protein CpaE [Microlunatus parietis]
MIKAVVAIADQVIVQELRSRLDQSEHEVEVVFVAESTQETLSAVIRHRPSLLFVHDQLGPAAAMPMIRELTLRHPGLAVLVVTSNPNVDAYRSAMDADARGVLDYPFGLEEVDHRLSAVIEWGASMSQALAGAQAAETGNGSAGGRVIAVAGAKGGLGTTIIATHLAWDVVRQVKGMRVCLVDLDVEKGDVPSYLDVSHRVSLADLAKISEDLTARAVADTVVVHNSGLHLLLAPTEIRETELITPASVRQIVAQLRRLYQLVIIDTGSAVTATQAAAVESADQTLQVVSADVPALRSARRQVVFWESLGVVSPDNVRVVVNRFQRRSEIQQDTVDLLVLGERSEVLIPDLDRGLERAGNSRTPAEVRNAVWWKSLRRIGQELGVTSRRTVVPAAAAGPNGTQPPAEAGPPAVPVAPAAGLVPGAASPGTANGRPNARANGEAGQVTVENVVLFPFALIVLVLCLQVVLLGLSFVWSGVAADAAARAVSIGADPVAAARDVVPGPMADQVVVDRDGPRVVVRVRTPLLMGDGVTRTVTVDVDHAVVEEPR